MKTKDSAMMERLNAYLEAHNRHEVEKALSFYTNDIRFETVGVWVKVGKEAVRALEDWDAAIGGYLSFTFCRMEGETLVCRGTESNDWFRLAGIQHVEYSSCKFVFREGLIAEVRAEFTQESIHAIEGVLRRVMAWVSKERSAELAMLMPTGEFEYGRQNALRWLTLLREWRESQQ